MFVFGSSFASQAFSPCRAMNTTASSLPILYSFRRCPYAMRARLALTVSATEVELREVVLRNKPAELLLASPKGTVPVLLVADQVLEHSLDIMLWALQQHDPEQWLQPQQGDLPDMLGLIAACDGEFKQHLDRYKYPERYPGEDALEHRSLGAAWLFTLNQRLQSQSALFGKRRALADWAIAPFVRQFAHTDDEWFGAQPWPGLQAWLQGFLDSDLFARVMPKFAPWQSGTAGVQFPQQR